MFAQKQKLRCSTACCFPRSLAAALAAQLVLTYCQTRLCDPILSFKKSNIVQQKHYFSIRIGFMIKGLFLSHSWVGCPSFLGAILHFQSFNTWKFILKTGIHCQKESCLNSAENESWSGGWNSSGVTHGDGVGGAWPPPHQPPISGFHIFGNYM